MPRVEECTVDCPPPFVLGPDSHIARTKHSGKGSGAGKPKARQSIPEEDVLGGQEACSSEIAGMWGSCGETCEQEQYTGDGCSGERKVSDGWKMTMDAMKRFQCPGYWRVGAVFSLKIKHPPRGESGNVTGKASTLAHLRSRRHVLVLLVVESHMHVPWTFRGCSTRSPGFCDSFL